MGVWFFVVVVVVVVALGALHTGRSATVMVKVLSSTHYQPRQSPTR